MSDRKSLSKKIRFEVFKRDSFKCQYCGKVAPNVVLEVDHIDPVSKGGSNDLLNLITSCFDCNRGKKNNKLDDDTVVVKQRHQLEQLQNRREQIQLMFDWKNDLENLSSEENSMIVAFIENKIPNYSVNENGSKKIQGYNKKYELADILEAIDLSAEKYLQYDNDGTLNKVSVEDFMNKIGGILYNKSKPPIDGKVSYIKGICKNIFNYWDHKKGAIILNNYIRALKDYGWTEDMILKDLDEEVIPTTKSKSNWTEWHQFMEKWTEDVKVWESKKEETDESDDSEITMLDYEDLDHCVEELILCRKRMRPAVFHIGKAFKNFIEAEFVQKIDSLILNYLEEIVKYYGIPLADRERNFTYHRLAHELGIYLMFEEIDDLTFYLNSAMSSLLHEMMENIDILRNENSDPEDFKYIYQKFSQSILSPEAGDNKDESKF